MKQGGATASVAEGSDLYVDEFGTALSWCCWCKDVRLGLSRPRTFRGAEVDVTTSPHIAAVIQSPMERAYPPG